MAERKFTGKNVQDAIKTGLEEMGLAIDEANIEIISEGASGIFGFGAKKAVIKISPVDFEAEVKEALEEKDETSKEKIEKFSKSVKKKADNLKEDAKELVENAEEKLEAFGEKIENRLEEGMEKLNDATYKKMDSTKHVEFLTEFLNGLFERMSISCEYDIIQKGETLIVNINSNEIGKIIGHRGETLDAIQYITRLAIHKQNLSYRSIIVQVENYREKREQTLRGLAKRLASRVERTDREVVLEPMRPFERRIIHETLQNNPKITTSSHGEEPNRYVVIELKK